MTIITQDNSAQHFLHETKDLLYADEATNSLMLGLCEGLLTSSDEVKNSAVLIRILEEGKTVSAASQTPPHNLVLTHATTKQLSTLADYLLKNKITFPGVVGPGNTAEEFARLWSRLNGQEFSLGMGQKIYKIETVSWPQKIRGSFRKASVNEADLLTQWLVEFGHESLPANGQKSFSERRPYIDSALKKGFAHVWEIDGEAVSMAFVGRPTQNGISVSGVYTPKALRKRGYASAVVSHLSQAMLDSGKQFCVLYTDLANLTSNKIYQDIGYREVSDSKMFLFSQRSTHDK